MPSLGFISGEGIFQLDVSAIDKGCGQLAFSVAGVIARQYDASALSLVPWRRRPLHSITRLKWPGSKEREIVPFGPSYPGKLWIQVRIVLLDLPLLALCLFWPWCGSQLRCSEAWQSAQLCSVPHRLSRPPDRLPSLLPAGRIQATARSGGPRGSDGLNNSGFGLPGQARDFQMLGGLDEPAAGQ